MTTDYSEQYGLNYNLAPEITSNSLPQTPTQIVDIIVPVFFGILFLSLLISFLKRHFLNSNRIYASLHQKILVIRIPKDALKKNNEQQADTPQSIQEQIATAENLFSVLGGLKAERGPISWLRGRVDHFSAEIVLDNGKINFYLAVPDYLQDTLEQQIHAAYPFAAVEEMEDYNIFSVKGVAAGAYLVFQNDGIFPIKTFRKIDVDPLNALTNALAKYSSSGEAVIQFTARSAHKRWHRKSLSVARSMQQGKSVGEALRGVGVGSLFSQIGSLIKGIWHIFSSSAKDPNQVSSHQTSAMESEAVKSIEEKNSHAGFDVNVRLVVFGRDKDTAKAGLDNIINAFAQFNIYSYGNSFKKAKFVSLKGLLSNSIHRSYVSRFKLLLNTEEMASLWHLPLASSETPNINWLEARKAPPPINIPTEGIVLGENNFRGVNTKIRIKEADRQRHMYIIGKSGTGKSVFQANMIIQDIQNNKGLCVIDPHGDLVDEILEHVPPERAEDVILFDPADTERPIGLNMLEFNNPEQKTFVINEMISIFDKLYDLKATGGPIFEQYMRNAMMLMMEDETSGSTLLEVPKILADASFRKYKLTKCFNPVVKDFWEKEAEKAGGEASLANMVPYITSKLTPFVASDLMRPIIAQQKSSFNFREVMDSGKILLIKLSKGKIGDMSANLLGMVIVGKLLMAALARVDTPAAERRDFYLYIDEFQNFITDSISIILSEARKYKLCLIIAHQYIGQLVHKGDTSIRDAVFGNVGTMVAFRIGPDDAELLAKQFAPVFNEFDLLNIPKYQLYIKMLIDNQNPPPFNVSPEMTKPGDRAIAGKIRELSRLKYGRDRKLVEEEIWQRIKLASTATPENPIM